MDFIKKQLNLVLNSNDKLYNIIRFVLIGGFNTFHNLIWFTVFSMLNINYIISYVTAYIICIIISFYLNCFFVFKTPPTLKKLLMFPLSSIPNFIISSLSIVLLVDVLHVNKYVSNILSALIAIPITYVIVNIILKDRKI